MNPIDHLLLRQLLGDTGATYIKEGETATGSFSAIISMGRTQSGSVVGSTMAASVGNVKTAAGADLSSVFIPCGFSLPGGFTSVTAGAETTDVLICVHTPQRGN
jgi:uncharacterized NAD-dependent epimerase/dehydratase family protein